jgi:hypothetical protein
VRLEPGGDGRSRIVVKAGGTAMPAPRPVHPLRFFQVDPAVTVQLVNAETDRCWVSRFGPVDTRINRGDRYKAR